jgi:hypothetical protein
VAGAAPVRADSPSQHPPVTPEPVEGGLASMEA